MKLKFLTALFVASFEALAVPMVVCPREAAPQVQLAAKEVARYVYLRTGALPTVVPEMTTNATEVIGLAINAALGPEAFTIKTEEQCGFRFWAITGGSDVGVLYGAYRFAEKLGVRFYLHGDVIPDERLAKLPDINDSGAPLFATRGIQPFHDFPEGPDWWNQDDYLAYIGQLAKLRMNFFGLHCYPEGGVGPEPLVWIGLPGDLDRKGRVDFSYPATWANTSRTGMWGYAAMKADNFCAGANQLFERDDYGPDVLHGRMPRPNTPLQCNALFDDVAAQMAVVFAQARALGVKTCIGTETPLTIPKLVQEHLKQQGKDPKDHAVVRELYEGIFRRIAKVMPVDYYWLWTPEHWTWQGNKPEELAATIADINAAIAALNKIGKPFTLATSGWVLGPQSDRAALDKLLPKESPMSCINRQVGHAPDEPGFAKVSNRPKWVIPWLENDPNLVAPQPWVGRMRTDAVDARLLGCTGLLGIHWRVKQMAPNVAALADAAWDQSWTPADYKLETTELDDSLVLGAVGGTAAHFTAPVAGADVPAVYQNVRYNMSAFRLEVPNGSYAVTLKFNEPHYTAAGKRVFGVKLQGRQVLEHLDLFAKVGQNKALDYSFNDIAVTNGQLRIEFTREVEHPCIAGIVVSNAAFQRRINCGGGAGAGYEADTAADHNTNPRRGRTMPVADFYTDFARANFGATVAEPAGNLFAKIDGTQLPEPTTWIRGPGGIKVEKAPWSQVKTKYAFVDELAALRPQVQGAGNLERFDYWLNTYRYMAALAEVACRRGELDRALPPLKTAKDPEKLKPLILAAARLRIELSRAWERMIGWQVVATDTPGELGTLANLEQHTRVQLKFLTEHDAELEKLAGEPLPAELALSKAYTGPARLTVPTARTLATKNEWLKLKAFALDAKPMASVKLLWRPLGTGAFEEVPLKREARAVYFTTLKAKADLEYYVQAETAAGQKLLWPATAPQINQTVLVWSPAK
jgi:hypothetical protein